MNPYRQNIDIILKAKLFSDAATVTGCQAAKNRKNKNKKRKMKRKHRERL